MRRSTKRSIAWFAGLAAGVQRKFGRWKWSLRAAELGHRDTSSSSHELPMESRAKVEPGSGKHGVFTHFPNDPNCDICLKTKITMASCRRRAGTVVPKAENFGDLTTADLKILSEGSESRNSHRYAVVVEDLATQWIQSCPCETKTSQETQKSLMKFLEPTRKPKVIYTDNSLNTWDYWESSAHSQGRDICGAVPIRSGQWMVDGFHAMLLRSAKYSRSLVWWKTPAPTLCKICAPPRKETWSVTKWKAGDGVRRKERSQRGQNRFWKEATVWRCKLKY